MDSEKHMPKLPPFDEYSPCPMCAHQRSPELKALVNFHDGEADGRGEVCELGGEQPHLHRKCIRCGFEWAEAVAAVAAPLTTDEILAVRALLSEIRT